MRTTNAKLVLACTNDLHSHCDMYPHIQATIQSEVPPKVPVLQLDAGDWYSGTVYSWLGPRASCPAFPELEYFSTHNVYAAVGNHEFDSTVKGFSTMLGKAEEIGYKGLICTNIALDDSCPVSKYYSNDLSFPNVLNESAVVHIENFGSVGIIAIMGDDASYGCEASIQGTGLRFLSLTQTDEKCIVLVRRLREELKCNMVVLLMHGSREETKTLKVSNLVDFCVEGHSHESYEAHDGHSSSQAQAYGSAVGLHEFILEPMGNGQMQPRLASSRVVLVSVDTKQSKSGMWSERMNKHVEDLLAEVGIVNRRIMMECLPPVAHSRLQRSANCTFASWILDSIVSELNISMDLVDFPIDGMFIANELIRGDFSKRKHEEYVEFEDIASLLEVGQSDPDSIGVEIYVLETTMAQLYRLHWAFMIGTMLITANAVPAYSSGLFLHSLADKLLATISRRPIRVATTKFLVDSLKTKVPGFVFDTTRVLTIHQASLSVLFYRHLARLYL